MVVTYAAAGSSHDRYFYERQQQMVAGVVVPPKLELANQDLVKSHVYSLWLSYTGVDLGDSMNQILDLDLEAARVRDRDGYPLKEDIKAHLNLSSERLQECFEDLDRILSDRFCQGDFQRVSWYNSQWLRDTLQNACHAFDRACDRWRNLYQDADKQLQEARDTIDRHSRGNIGEKDRKTAESLAKEAQRQRDLLVGQSQNKNNSQFDFYPYRYFAAEGFLPGFNFPRLPVRTYIRAGEKGEFISRPRTVAIRELAPNNILYYEGNKYQIDKVRLPVSGVTYNRIAICHNCGYLHDGDDFQRDLCANCGASLATDDKGNAAKLTHVLEMDNAIARRTNRITCDEEERLKYGYKLTTHFRYASDKQQVAIVKANDGTELLRLTYGETADIWRINRGLSRSPEKGFQLDTTSGEWVGNDKKQAKGSIDSNVNLMVKDTSNILIIEPLTLPENNTEAYIITLQYTLERAIQASYKLENSELISEKIGTGKSILFWEAAEGGAGVLSQIFDNSHSFQNLAKEALAICHFIEPKDSCDRACYQCLLSYSNQFDHPYLDRHLIHSFLQQLISSNLTFQLDEGEREKRYQILLEQTDPNSQFERIVLQAIYQQGIKLPDSAQELIPEANCKPDFLYKKDKIAIFCDGSVHDRASAALRDRGDRQTRDLIQRQDLQYITGYLVLSINYREDLSSKLKYLQSLITN